jgi:hypothetical protein
MEVVTEDVAMVMEMEMEGDAIAGSWRREGRVGREGEGRDLRL